MILLLAAIVAIGAMRFETADGRVVIEGSIDPIAAATLLTPEQLAAPVLDPLVKLAWSQHRRVCVVKSRVLEPEYHETATGNDHGEFTIWQRIPHPAVTVLGEDLTTGECVVLGRNHHIGGPIGNLFNDPPVGAVLQCDDAPVGGSYCDELESAKASAKGTPKQSMSALEVARKIFRVL